jgi:hypothetical protein
MLRRDSSGHEGLISICLSGESIKNEKEAVKEKEGAEVPGKTDLKHWIFFGEI